MPVQEKRDISGTAIEACAEDGTEKIGFQHCFSDALHPKLRAADCDGVNAGT